MKKKIRKAKIFEEQLKLQININNKHLNKDAITTESNYSTADTIKTTPKPKLFKNFFISKHTKYKTATDDINKKEAEIIHINKTIKENYSLDKSIDLFAKNNLPIPPQRQTSCFALCKEKNNTDCKLI